MAVVARGSGGQRSYDIARHGGPCVGRVAHRVVMRAAGVVGLGDVPGGGDERWRKDGQLSGGAGGRVAHRAVVRVAGVVGLGVLCTAVRSGIPGSWRTSVGWH
jgi:hypothetical protein